MVRESTALSGMRAICDYVNRSEPTVLSWIREMDFPAKKIGGIWESDRRLIDEWRRLLVAGRIGQASNLLQRLQPQEEFGLPESNSFLE